MSAVIEITNAILEILIFIFFFNQTLEKKNIKKSNEYIIISSIVFIHIMRSFVPSPTYINYLITLILWSVIVFSLYKDSILKKIVILSICFTIILICDIFSRYTTAVILNISYNANSAVGIQRYLIMIFNIFLFFSILSCISLCIKRSNTKIPFKYWIMLLMFPIFSLFIIICTDILMIMADVNDIKYIFMLLIIIIGLLYFNMVIFRFIDSYSAKLQLNAAKELIKKQSENYAILENTEKNLLQLQHDISKHMGIMKDMIKNDPLNESKKFMDSLNKLSEMPLSTVYTDDITLDSILNVECRKATGAGIKYLVKTHNITAFWNIDPADKSTILCNALDNAIEASSKTDEKFIIIDIAIDAKHTKIRIENSSLPVKIHNNSIVTTKSDFHRHGFGIASIKQTLKKYNGALNISYSDGITSYVILLNNTHVS